MERAKKSMVKMLASASLFVVVASGCVMIPYQPTSETTVAPEDELPPSEMILSFETKDLVDRISEVIESEDDRIEVLSASDFKDVIFPDKDYRLSSFFKEGNCSRIARELDVDYAVLIGALETVTVSQGGDMAALIGYMSYGGFWGAEYHKEKATLSASIVDLRNERPLSRITANAEGTSGGLGLFYGLFLISLEDSSVKKGLARQIANTLLDHSKKDKLRVTVFVLDPGDASVATLEKRDELRKKIAGGDDTYETKKELAVIGGDYQPLEQLAWDGHPEAAVDLYRLTGDIRPMRKLEKQGNQQAKNAIAAIKAEESHSTFLTNSKYRIRAEAGDADAQLQLYYSIKTEERLAWLCRAADDGNALARYRTAMNYEKGIEGVDKDNGRAQMWYRLAATSGHVWANSNADRLAKTATEADLEEVQRLLNNWQPGQCEADLVKSRDQIGGTP